MVSGRLVGTELQKTRLYKILLWKAYFDKGYGLLLSYPKYILFLIGLGDVIASGGEYKRVAIIGVLIGIVCLIVGRLCYKKRWVDTEIEIQNVFNPFTREVRAYIETSGANRKV